MQHQWRLLGVVVLCLLTTAMAVGAEVGMTALTVDLREVGGPFRGWGTSLAWWANGVGDWPDETVDEVVRLITDPEHGLGLNVFRYNIGGGDQPGHHHMRQWGDVPGFKPAEDGPYDWVADAAQRRMLLKLIQACDGQAIVEAFSNSPPWWMTVSGCVAGAVDGGPNLKPEYEGAFADYLADVVQAYKQHHGLVFDTLEPFNEPDVRWWKAGKNQEGLHIPHDQQARLIRLARAALDQRGLRDIIVSATDANSIDDALASLLSFDTATLAALGQVNTHSYYGSKRVELRDAAVQRAKPLWQSETGPLNVGGTEFEQIMKVAHRLVIDINQLRPEVWCLWQVVAGGEWGCLHDDPERKSFRIGKKFHVMAAFTRHIRPGDRFVNLDSDRVLAAISGDGRDATIVLVNCDKTPHTFRLTIDSAEPLPATAVGACASEVDGLAPITPVAVRDEMLETTTPPESVTCLRLPAVR